MSGQGSVVGYRARAVRLKAMVPLLLAAAVGACGDGGPPDERAGADDFSNRVGLGAQPGARPGAAGVVPQQLPATPATNAPAFTPRIDIVAAVEANRRKRRIAPDSALPQGTAKSEAELAAQTRAEMDKALQGSTSK